MEQLVAELPPHVQVLLGMRRAIMAQVQPADPAARGEQADERARLVRGQRRELTGRTGGELLRQGVDRGVEGLVRQRLAGVAAAREDRRRVGDGGRAEPVEQPGEQGRLAGAGRADEQHEGGPGGEGEGAGGELVLAADELADRADGRGGDAEAAQDVGAVRAIVGALGEQGAAQVDEVGGGVLGQRVGRRRARRHAAGQRLVEHHADGVPVARGRGGGAVQQLGGDEAERAGEAALAAGGRRDEAEVDDLDPALGRDEHVRRLEVAVQQAGAVQRVDAGGELAERVAQDGLGGRGAARADELEPADAGDELHRQVPLAAGRVERELLDGDEVAVAEVGGAAELLLEPLDRRLVGARQRLEGDPAALRIAPLEDDTHAAAADRADDRVDAELGARSRITEQARPQLARGHAPLRLVVRGVRGGIRGVRRIGGRIHGGDPQDAPRRCPASQRERRSDASGAHDPEA
jgi:hypothetical protein